MVSVDSIKVLSAIVILLITIIGGAYPFIKKLRTAKYTGLPIGEALAAGVFLGAGLIHMLGSSAKQFAAQGINYPWPFLLAGITFLILLLLEHLGREMYEHDGEDSIGFAILATVMLSMHSFLAGTALGVSHSLSIVIVILFALLAHKWAASFALAVYINKSRLSHSFGILLFLVFALMVPLGIFFGIAITTHIQHHPLLEPTFSALAAGTFLYLGTLHGLKRAVMVEKCCNLKHFSFVIIGFTIMAVVAIWI